MENNIFIQELKKDKARYEKFLLAKREYLITEFDEEIKSRLRKIYWGGFFQALIYIYYMPTDFETIGNKVELLAKVLEGEEFNIVHASTISSRQTPFYEYNHNHLDYNSYIEIKKGHNTWVYDLYSLLKFDKQVYEELEEPTSHKNDPNNISLLEVISSQKLEQVKKIVGEEDYSLHLKEIYVKTMEKISELLNQTHPYYGILLKEIELQKKQNNFEELKRQVEYEERCRRTSKVYQRK